MNSWLVILPPLLAIILAIVTRQVILSLVAGIFVGAVIVHGNPVISLLETFEYVVGTFSDAGNTRILMFSTLVGAIIHLVEYSGGVQGFVRRLTDWNIGQTRKSSGLISIAVGSVLFIESNVSILTVGTIFKPIFDKLKIAREKLAYIADASCSPVKVLVPFNGWGAFIVGAIAAASVENPTEAFIRSIPFYVYPVVALLIVIMTVLFDWNLGPMKQFESEALSRPVEIRTLETTTETSTRPASFFVLPISLLVLSLLGFMLYTGDGDITQGSGSKSVLYAVLITLMFMFTLYLGKKIISVDEFLRESFVGMHKLLPITVILMLTFAINQVFQDLQTGKYVAQLVSSEVSAMFIPVLIFIISAFISFSTGTSWGTFAIMLSIGIPIADLMGLHLPLIIGAVISGGIWGDHSSPISDSTVISSLAADVSHIDHVRSQLPYAFTGGMISAILFIILGVLFA